MSSIKLGTKDISSVILGTTNISKICKGTSTVWESITWPVWEDWSDKQLSTSRLLTNTVIATDSKSFISYKGASSQTVIACGSYIDRITDFSDTYVNVCQQMLRSGTHPMPVHCFSLKGSRPETNNIKMYADSIMYTFDTGALDWLSNGFINAADTEILFYTADHPQYYINTNGKFCKINGREIKSLPFKVTANGSIDICKLPNRKKWVCIAEPSKHLLYLTACDDSEVSMSLQLPEPYTRCWVSVDADLYIHLVGLTKDGKLHYFQSTIGDYGLTNWAQIKEISPDNTKTIQNVYVCNTPNDGCITIVVGYDDYTAEEYHKIYGE